MRNRTVSVQNRSHVNRAGFSLDRLDMGGGGQVQVQSVNGGTPEGGINLMGGNLTWIDYIIN